jgi:hypothetical protein
MKMPVASHEFFKEQRLRQDVQDECEWAHGYIEELISHWDKMSPFELKETLGEIADRLRIAARQEEPND